jgi:tetratricopeptide (TPR) repeat protein
LAQGAEVLAGLAASSPAALRPRRPVRRTVIVQPLEIAHIRSLLDAGKVREALAAAERIGPLAHWAGSQAKKVAGDLAQSLGAPRLSATLHLQAWRRARNDNDMICAGLQVVLEQRGPWAVWHRLRGLRLPEGKAAPQSTHKLWLLRAMVAGIFRDFETAEAFWQKAEQIAPNTSSGQIVRARMLEREDRFEEALTAARLGLQLGPGCVPAIATTAHLLQKLERDQESLAMLEDATRRVESVPLLMQLAGLQSALELHREGIETLDRIRDFSPLLEKATSQWVLGLRLQLAWRCGDAPRALAAARELGAPGSLAFANRVETCGEILRRVQLEVPFVAQHHNTCVPATLAALGRFWNKPIDQKELADEITYGGTFSVHQRTWLEHHGWLTRAFTVTWEAACALLDRGIPFELLTADATSGHAQAVCGYDAAQQSLLIRDPNLRHVRRVPAETFLEAFRATGPCGLVVLPQEKAALLEGLELPDARLHELLHQVWAELDKHNHEPARRFAATAQAQAPEHWLTWYASLAMARYDGNQPLVAELLERLHAQFPQDARLGLEKLSCLTEHDQRDERLELLGRLCAAPRAHPVFFVRYARELAEDAREQATAVRFARRALRLGEVSGGMSCLAGLCWQRRQFEEALELYRFNTCLSDTQEHAARQYFNAARYRNQTEQGLQFLRARFERFGAKSPEVAISLATVLQQLGRNSDAREVLQRAQKLLPGNADLELFAVQCALRDGQPEQAGMHLQRAQERVSPATFRRMYARIAEQQGELATALASWREVLRRDPHSVETHSAIAQLLADLEGRPVALRHLEKTCARFPWHFQLHKLWFSWQEADYLLSAEPIADRLLGLNPRDADACRQKARILTARGKFAEALEMAEQAVRLDPTHPQGHACVGRVFLRQGQLVQAQEYFRRAIALAVDYGEFMFELLDCCNTSFDRRLALDFIRTEMTRHLVYGEGVLAFRELARVHLAPEDLLKTLHQVVAQRPDLWHAWVALIRELIAQGDAFEALNIARSAVDRLPDSAPLWGALASAHRQNGDAEPEVTALEKVVELNPGDPGSICRLADALERHEQASRAKTLLEDLLMLQPRQSPARLLLAQLLWREEKRDHALEHVKQAIRYTPNNETAWSVLGAWARALGQPKLVLETAQRLTTTRREDPAVWLRLARLHQAADDPEPALEAVETALGMYPPSVEGHDLRISLLLRLERLDAALTASRTDVWGVNRPPLLQAREASVLRALGEHAAAYEALKKVLDQTPTLLWGWRLLGGWYMEEGKRTEAETIVQRLLELGGRDADSCFWIAQIRLAANDTPEGVELLERALSANPDHLPARIRLMYIQLNTNQFHALDETLRHLRRLGAMDWYFVGQISLALKGQNHNRAFEHLEQLLKVSYAEERAVINAVRAIRDSGAAAPLETILRQQLAQSPTQPSLGRLWVEACVKQGQLPRAADLLKLCPESGPRRRAIHTWLEGLHSWSENGSAKNRQSASQLLGDLRQLQQAESDWFQSDLAAWNCFGSALSAIGAHREACKWFAEWRQRPGLRPWALANIMNAFLDHGLNAEALEAGRLALDQPVEDRPVETVLLVAWLEANTDMASQAGWRLKEVVPEKLPPGWRVALDVINSVVRVGNSQDSERRQIARAEWARLKAARDWRGMSTWKPGFRKLFRTSFDILAAKSVSLSPCLWSRRMTWRWPWTRGE